MTEGTAVCKYKAKEGDPLVSIIIPVYNVSHYLPQCLESVIHQTYQNIEIIIVDDGSTDDSKDICDQYANNDNRIRVIHTDNKGLASARNLGVDNAAGTYLSFIDSDDWMELHTIHTLVKAAEQMTADIVCAKRCLEYVGKTVHSQGDRERVQVFHGEEIISAYVSGVFRDVVWNKLYRADRFAQIRFPDGHNYEDAFTTWKRMKKLSDEGGTVVAISEELFHFRVRKSSITHTVKIQTLMDCWNACCERNEGLPEYQEKLTASCYGAILIMWINYGSLSREEKKIAKRTILEMSKYSKAMFHHAIKGDNSWIIKMISILSLTSSPLALWICYSGGKLYRSLIMKRKGHVMFD